MAKWIRLTWRNEGKRVTEECWLVEEDDPIFMVGSTEPLTITTDDGVGSVVGTIMGERVMFEDEVGLFGVLPKDVVNIEVLEG